MKLQIDHDKVLSYLDEQKLKLDDDCRSRIRETSRLTCDSRQVDERSIFIAIRGETVDGHSFIPDLLNKAPVIICSSSYSPPSSDKTSFIPVTDTIAFSQDFAPVYYNHPGDRLRVVGITGTNGKTTVTYMLEALYRQQDLSPAVIGTINVRYANKILPNPNTTPDSVFLQSHIYDIVNAGCDVLIMEVSSHALSLGRVNGIAFDSAVFTNLSPDHLDFHPDMDAYLEAKLTIFDLLAESTKPDKKAVIWQNTKGIDKIRKRTADRDYEVYYYGSSPDQNTLAVHILDSDINGQDITLRYGEEDIYAGRIGQIGDYNVLNACAAMMEFINIAHNDLKVRFARCIEDVLSDVHVPGRIEKVANGQDALVVVDYAHTPDALENVLKTLSRIPHTRLISLFGCGGDRDNSKRPLMGEISGRLADWSIVTSDNPRTEDPGRILDMIEEGISTVTDKYEVISDREKAIQKAAEMLGKGDILCIAGKGHEDYQILGKKKIHFDDRETAARYLK